MVNKKEEEEKEILYLQIYIDYVFRHLKPRKIPQETQNVSRDVVVRIPSKYHSTDNSDTTFDTTSYMLEERSFLSRSCVVTYFSLFKQATLSVNRKREESAWKHPQRRLAIFPRSTQPSTENILSRTLLNTLFVARQSVLDEQAPLSTHLTLPVILIAAAGSL